MTFSRERSIASRLGSLDFVRGVAMMLMAIDHVRVYSGLPPGGPSAGIFFTRWITNFVAPAFVFLAGTSVYLHGRKFVDRSQLSKFLLLRGAWLILLELTVLRVAWTFNFDFGHYVLAGVIWMLGWCMILMAGLARLPILVNAMGGGAIVALHNVTDLFGDRLDRAFGNDGPNWLLNLLYFGSGSAIKLGDSGPSLSILYVLIPWIGLMMLGYAFGQVMEMTSERRRRISLRVGVGLVALFIVLRAMNVYGDPRPWKQAPAAQLTANQNARAVAPAAFRFLNTTKYPASLDFLLMTLGPMFVLLGIAENLRGKAAAIVQTFGRVPLFYYLLHIPLIHFAACVVSLVRSGHVNMWLFANHPMAAGRAPDGYTWSLGLLYAVYAICLVLLYFPCRWFAELRARRKSVWLSYL